MPTKKARPGKGKPQQGKGKPKKASPHAQTPEGAPAYEPAGSHPSLSFPVVAIGASAGGLQAFTALLRALPPTTGMAFVLIQHLEPSHESILTGLLAKETKMLAVEVSDGLPVEPDRIYVIPPNKSMTVRKGILRLSPRVEGSGLQRPIDEFAMALAEEQGPRAIGVVLSGTGSDGTYGLKAIKAAGGVTFAQEPKTAQWNAMPMSAITAGSVDFVLPPAGIAAELARIGRHPYVTGATGVSEGSDLDKICLILRAAVGVDFRLYKQATVLRRISRRMALHKITSLNKYALFLKQNRDEPQSLADDIFIHVTSFFRDPECFQALRKHVFSSWLLRKPRNGNPEDEPIRIWVAGCSTGEEVYSIAMCLLEELGERASRTKLQIFGTDIQERALAQARAGIYTESAVSLISSLRLKRFFTRTDHGYQILKSIRDACVFVRHDLTRDPPFSRLDLISCRNVLIYMGSPLQKRILSTFQYALKPGGSLFLGTSESVSDYSEAFAPTDARHRIFQRKAPATTFREVSSVAVGIAEAAVAPVRTMPPPAPDFRKEAEAAILEHYSPPALVVDRNLHIVHFQGNTSPYLAPATGQPSFHLLKMVRPEFVVALRTAIANARKEGIAVRRDDVRFDFEGRPCIVRMEVRPLSKGSGKPQQLLVVFHRIAVGSADAAETPAGKQTGAAKTAGKAVKLERELVTTRDHLRTLIAEHETAQEEMKAANEEILSSNEELQSTNEELETAKEELQSSNEELITLNDELQHRNAELDVLTHDLSNLLVGVDIPVLVLDSELRVRRFTPMAGQLLNLIGGDVGRPFSNIASTLNVEDWKALLHEVTAHGRIVEREVSDKSGHRYSMRVRPYKSDNRIEGVLVVFLDTDIIYRARDNAQKSSDYAHAIVETIHEALAVVDSDFRIVTVNRCFGELFHVQPADVLGKSFFGREPGQCTASPLRGLLKDLLAGGDEIRNLELGQDIPGIGQLRLVVNAARIAGTRAALIAMEDITVRKLAQERSEKSSAMVRTLLDASSQAVVTMKDSGTIVMVSGHTESIFGYKAVELIGQPIGILLPQVARLRHTKEGKVYFARTDGSRAQASVPLDGRRMDGTIFPVEVSLTLVEPYGEKLTVAFLTDITERAELEKAAQLHASQVQALAARLLSVQEEERRRVSRELHDQICQQLASLAIDIGTYAASPESSRPERRQSLKKLQERVVQASEATRHIAYRLHPSVLDDLGLVASLRALCKQFSTRDGISVRFHPEQLPAAMPREIVSCLYRVAQESLQNVASHSGAKTATVSVSSGKGSVLLSIVDDGSGFDIAAATGTGGLGLVGMEERARLVNGKLSIHARPGHGTRIVLEVPLTREST